MAREINLVPDIKNEMIKTLKLRNFIFFLCIVVASASVAITFIFGAIVGGQQIAINNKKTTIASLSTKLNSYSDRDEFLKIKDQLDNISALTDNKTVASRTFNILSALIPQDGSDEISISELNINLSEGDPVFTFEAQANAGQAPFIDYRVLDSFKKSMQYMRYDYGHYVDAENNEIPAYCIIERDASGAHFSDPTTKDLYAYWTINAEGCNSIERAAENDENTNETTPRLTEDEISRAGYTTEDYNGTTVVRIWRTPQISWYKKSPRENEPHLTETGEIKNLAHFESECIDYELIFKNNSLAKIDETNNSCILVPGETDDDRMAILESSNGRDSSEQLVLRFSARIVLDPEVYNFNNYHMLALGPSERRNVTDSYVQLQSIFAERAKDCQEGDTACQTEGND